MNTKPHVLIVDNEEVWHQHLQGLFDSEFDIISHAKNYGEAMEVINKAERPFDILITEISYDDVQQGEEGFDLVSYLEEKRTYTQVIILTRDRKIAYAIRASKNRADFLLKTPEDGSEFNFEYFLQVVKDALAKIINIDIFVLMPLAPNYKETYALIQEVASELDLTCKRADDFPLPGSIMEQVENSIERSRIIIADLSDKNLNVYFETGISHAKGKPVILLAHNENDLVRGLEGHRVIFYENSLKGARELKTELKRQIEFLLSNDRQPQKPYYQKERGMLKFCLAITANSKPGEDTYKSIIRPVTTTQGMECKYVWDFYKAPNTRDTTKTIKDTLKSADIIITDLTGKEADVYYLSGFAFGLDRYPIILYDKREKIPFGIKAIGKIPYLKDTEDHRNEAKMELTEAIRKHGNVKDISQGAIMNNTSQIKVFINHAREDKPLVRQLYSELRKHSWIDAWFDEEKLLPGQDWELEINKALKDANAVLICMSNVSVNKIGYVQAEIYKAKELQKRRPPGFIYMIPVLLEKCQVPDNLQEHQWVNISEPGMIDLIIKSLETLR